MGFVVASYNFFDQTMVKPLDNLKSVFINNINYISSNLGPADTVRGDSDEIIGLFKNYSRDVGAINVHQLIHPLLHRVLLQIVIRL